MINHALLKTPNVEHAENSRKCKIVSRSVNVCLPEVTVVCVNDCVNDCHTDKVAVWYLYYSYIVHRFYRYMYPKSTSVLGSCVHQKVQLLTYSKKNVYVRGYLKLNVTCYDCSW